MREMFLQSAKFAEHILRAREKETEKAGKPPSLSEGALKLWETDYTEKEVNKKMDIGR